MPWAQNQIHPRDERHVAIAPTQALSGQVKRNQGRGTGGIHHETGACQVEKEGGPVGKHGRRVARAVMRLDRQSATLHLLQIIVETRTDIHSRVRSGNFASISGILRRVIQYLQQPS